VAILRGQLNVRARVSPTEELAVTAVSVGELMHGAFKSAQVNENLSRLGVLLSDVAILPYDVAAARQFGRVKAELEHAGKRLGDLDLQIASTALAFDSPLVTHNRQHFERVPGLKIEDWLAEG
jgi:tRNA(fMet)-specific endonuclease VapC